jgi:energy-converting hydrogenase Eha subunit A
MAGWREGDLPKNRSQDGERMNKPAMKVLWKRTYSLYCSGWRRHFLTALPPAVFSVLVYVAGNVLLHELSRGFRLSGRLDRTFWILIFRTLAVRLPEFGLPWLMTAVAFAAVSSAILGNHAAENERRIADSYTSARERLGPILAVGLITFLVMVLGYAVVALCTQVIVSSPLAPKQHRVLVLEAVLGVGLALWVGLLSRAGLSIPYLMDHDGAGAWRAIKTSIRMSDGYEPFFIFLAVQTVLFSLLGPWLGRQALLRLWARGLISAPVYEWLRYSLDALAPAAVETVLFVGFTVLYMELKRTAHEAGQEDVSSEAVSAAPLSPR